MAIEVVLGVDAALVFKYGTANQAVVKGLNKMTLPSMERAVIDISEFRRDFSYQLTGEGKYGQFGVGGNMLLGDTKGQDQARTYLKANTKITDARLYLNTSDFLACDLEGDPESCMQIAGVTPGQADKNGVFSLDVKMIMGGDPATFVAHLSGTTIAFVKGATSSDNDTITDSGSGFVTAGFEVGQVLIAEQGAAAPLTITYHKIKTVAAGVLTLESLSTITAAAAGTAVTLHGGRL